MSSNYQQKKMMNALGAIDTKGNIVLEQFQDGTALLFQPGNAQPFCVATDYDRATASWSYGKYFSDLGCAYEAADPEIIEDASVRWVKPSVQTPTSISPSAARASFPTKPASLPKRRPVSSRLRTSAVMRPFADRMKSPGQGELKYGT